MPSRFNSRAKWLDESESAMKPVRGDFVTRNFARRRGPDQRGAQKQRIGRRRTTSAGRPWSRSSPGRRRRGGSEPSARKTLRPLPDRRSRRPQQRARLASASRQIMLCRDYADRGIARNTDRYVTRSRRTTVIRADDMPHQTAAGKRRKHLRARALGAARATLSPPPAADALDRAVDRRPVGARAFQASLQRLRDLGVVFGCSY